MSHKKELVKTDFAKRLDVVMQYQGWTQENLSDKVGVKVAALNRWLNHGVYPQLESFRKLVEVTGVSANWYLGVQVPDTVPRSVDSKYVAFQLQEMLG